MKTIPYAAFVLCILFCNKHAQAQDKNENYEHPMINLYIGPGLGLDYGGIGGKLEYLPVKYVGVFGCIGYNLVGLGWNVGASYKILPGHKVTPTVNAMYGYNAAINIDENNKATYYGPSFGAGVDIRMGRRDNKLTANIFRPVRSSKFKKDYDYAKTQFETFISPVNVSVGFNYALN